MLSIVHDKTLEMAVPTARARPVPIEEESTWRRSTQLHGAGHTPVLTIGRWHEECHVRHQLTSDRLDDHYTIEVLLGVTSLECDADGRSVRSGTAEFGATQVTRPGEQVSCLFRHSVEAMHLFVPRTLVVSTFEDVTQHSCPGTFELNDPCFSADPSIGTLATALAQARTLEGPCAKLYSDSLSVALLSRLMAAQLGAADNPIVRIGLPLWRQRRAIDFMNANLSEPITLQDIAKHTGLSRMYFAARFKEATGMSPHTFLLQRRLARAKEFLASSNYSLLDVALEVGFQSQAHFSTVFRKLTGTTPGRWRASNTQATRAQT